jgi:DNA polymerase-3 subunit gamma/tau
VWPEIIADVGRKSKKIAALASGATVRDLEGQTVVLTFRFPAHAKMVAAEPGLITDALYEALGGRWQIRCDVSGEAGGVVPAPGGPARRPASAASPAPAQTRAAQSTAPTRQRETSPQATASAPPSNDDDDWPEPARPGGLAAPAAAPANAVDDPGGGAGTAGQANEGRTAGTEVAADFAPARSAGVDRPVGEVARGSAQIAGSTNAAERDSAQILATTTSSQGPPTVAPAGESIIEAPRRAAVEVNSAPIKPGNGSNSTEPANRPAPSSGIAAARAAAAGARNITPAKPGTSTRLDNGAPPANGTTPAPGRPETWSDAPPADEPPYDPDYDAPVRDSKAAAYEGFDPGDEPLDDVIDEKTARQSSEQQAMQLLQDMFGAEKIGEA